jgi:hypothetical protein
MIAYEFYWCDPGKGYELLGVLPERRKNTERITQKSVMGWVEKVFANDLSTKDIYFIQVTTNEYTGNIFRPTPFFVTQQKVKK